MTLRSSPKRLSELSTSISLSTMLASSSKPPSGVVRPPPADAPPALAGVVRAARPRPPLGADDGWPEPRVGVQGDTGRLSTLCGLREELSGENLQQADTA